MLQSGQVGSSPSLGDSIGRYRLIAELARGGMGIVYVAASQGPGGFSKLVALKELKPDLAGDVDFLAMFLDEARIAARLNHPNIVQTNDVDVHDGRHFIAMEYLEGRSLAQVQKRFAAKGGLPQRVILTALRDVLAALDYAHELADGAGRLLGFVHRDISPHNVFITFDGHTKVIDFGIAKARDSSLETKTGVLKGRVTYMAPEQLAHQTDRRSDLFSVGVILAEVITGKRLWHGLNDMEVLSRLVRSDVPKIEMPGAPAQLLEICRTALEPRPDDRYASAALMRDALDEYLWTQGGSPKPREVSAVLMREFEPERRARRELVEAALGRLRSGEGGRLATLAPPESRDADAESHKPSVSRSDAHAPVDLGTLPPEPASPLLMALPLDEARAIRLRPRRPLLMLGLGAGVALVGAVLLFSLRSTPPAAALLALPAPVAAPSRSATPARVTRERPAAELPSADLPSAVIVLSVNVIPSSAQLSIDDQLMTSNPFVGSFPRGAAWHRVRASAPGYLTKERLVSFADNVVVDLALAPRPIAVGNWRQSPMRRSEPHPAPATRPTLVELPAAATTAPPQPSAPARAVANDIAPRSAADAPRRRSIDAVNPYGEEQ